MQLRTFMNSLSETESIIMWIMLILTIGMIHELIIYIRKYNKKRKEEKQNKKKAIQWLVNALKRIEVKYHKSFINWHKKQKD